MTDDLTFEELPPGRYNGTVEKIRYSFKAATHIVITYKLGTPNGEVRHNDDGAATGDTKLRANASGRRNPSGSRSNVARFAAARNAGSNASSARFCGSRC